MAKKRKITFPIDNLEFEKSIWKEGFQFIGGIDEAGRGASAGPVVAACVVMPKGLIIKGLTDSKSINKKKLKYFEEQVKENCLSYGIGEVSPEVIDEINIKEATRLAMKYAIEDLVRRSKNKIIPDYLLVDGTEVVDVDTNQKFIIDGDILSHSISAASIIAKVYRDEKMEQLSNEFNDIYKWSTNAGYNTKDHKDALKEHGITPYHRKSYSTIKELEKQPTLFDDFDL